MSRSLDFKIKEGSQVEKSTPVHNWNVVVIEVALNSDRRKHEKNDHICKDQENRRTWPWFSGQEQC